MTTVASFIGGSIGILVLSWLTPVIVAVAMAFGPAEYFALILFCLIAVSTIAGSAPAKNTVIAAIGPLAGTIGIDIYDGTERYTFGFKYRSEEHTSELLSQMHNSYAVY